MTVFVVDRTRIIVVKYVDDITLDTWVKKEDDIAGRKYFSRIDQFQSRTVKYGYLKEATRVNEFLISDKQVWKTVTKERSQRV